MREYIKSAVKKLHINLSDEQADAFVKYYEMLVLWNKKINLTSITDFHEVVLKHFVDSLSIVYIFDMNTDAALVDMGTGAGFPGIPLKIAFPRLKVTLVDSLSKRINFLNHVINELNLKDITAIHARAEEYGNSKYRETFDLCVTRAVSNLSVISEYCLPLIKCGGYFIPYKANNVEEEIFKYEMAVEEFGGAIDDVAIFDLPDSELTRSLILIYKDTSTPKKYPRKNGIPIKRPII